MEQVRKRLKWFESIFTSCCRCIKWMQLVFGDLQVQTVHEAHVGNCAVTEARGESFRVIHKSPTHPHAHTHIDTYMTCSSSRASRSGQEDLTAASEAKPESKFVEVWDWNCHVCVRLFSANFLFLSVRNRFHSRPKLLQAGGQGKPPRKLPKKLRRPSKPKLQKKLKQRMRTSQKLRQRKLKCLKLRQQKWPREQGQTPSNFSGFYTDEWCLIGILVLGSFKFSMILDIAVQRLQLKSHYIP